jgi:hypothetical protein
MMLANPGLDRFAKSIDIGTELLSLAFTYQIGTIVINLVTLAAASVKVSYRF